MVGPLTDFISERKEGRVVPMSGTLEGQSVSDRSQQGAWVLALRVGALVLSPLLGAPGVFFHFCFHGCNQNAGQRLCWNGVGRWT